jgi:hypothetical protein
LLFVLALLLFVLALLLFVLALLLFVLAVILSAAKDPEAFYSPTPFVPFSPGFLSLLLLSK